MSSIATAVSTINVPFHGSDLYVVSVGDEAYTPMRPIIDGMGLTYQGQADKLKSRFSKGVREIMIPTKGGKQTMLCLALRKLNGWLQTINPNKVKPEFRDTVIQYQEECDDVLYEYWTNGQVTNPRKTKKAATGKITNEQQEAIKQLVMNRGKALPKENQAKAIITMWSSLKSHFGCSYKDINEGQFTEALSLASRVPLDGEYLENKRYTMNLTGDELCSIAWLYKAAKHMREDIEIVGYGLSKLQSPLGPSLETMAREYSRTLDNAWKILNRETRGLDDREMASQNCSLNWERVLPDLKVH